MGAADGKKRICKFSTWRRGGAEKERRFSSSFKKGPSNKSNPAQAAIKRVRAKDSRNMEGPNYANSREKNLFIMRLKKKGT